MTNKEVVEDFFRGFDDLDAERMISCLADDIVYNDPIYGILNGEDVRSLWKMRCKDLSGLSLEIIEFKELDHEYATCKWRSSFFSKSAARQVDMVVTSFMKLRNGKIAEHSDAYKLSDWLAKAYGVTGVFLGWTGWMKKREQKKFHGLLEKFIENSRFFSGNQRREHDYDFSDR